MAYVSLGCCLCLALVFGLSVVSKARREAFRDFTTSAGPLTIVPRGLRTPVAMTVLVLEAVLTVAMLAGTFVRPVALLGFALTLPLLLAFTASIVVTLRRGIRGACRCFGASTTPLGKAHVLRNAVLLAVAVVGLAATSTAQAPVELPGAVVAAFAGLVAGLLVTRFDDLIDLFSSAGATAGRV